jgi:hypothetical protein
MTDINSPTNPIKNTDGFFEDLSNSKPYFKAALEGFASTGKTRTMAEIAIGIHRKIESTKSLITHKMATKEVTLVIF